MTSPSREPRMGEAGCHQQPASMPDTPDDERVAHAPGRSMMPIPEELRRLPHWVGWKYQRRDGHVTKVPHVLGEGGRKARANDPSTWRGFDAAEAFGPRYDGIGFELLKGGGLP